MSREEPTELIQAKKFVEEGKYNKALILLENFEEREKNTNSSLLSHRLLKSSILNNVGNYKDAFQYAEQAYQVSQDLKSDLQSIDALLNMSFALTMELSLDKAFDLIVQSEDLLKTCSNESLIVIKQKQASIDYIKGLFYFYKNDADRGIKYAEQSLKLREELGSSRELAEPLYVLGLIYTLLKYDLDLAKAYTERSQRHAKESNQTHIIAYNLLILGMIYLFKGELEQAITYIKQSLTLSEEINNKRYISSLYNNLAMVYQQQGDIEQALVCLEKSLVVAKEINNKWNIGHTTSSMVTLYIEKNDKENAQKYLELLKQISEHEEFEMFDVLYRLGKALILKISARTHNRAKAEELLVQITEEEVIMSEATIVALINLCDLLIEELSIINDVEIIDELKPLIKQLTDIAENSNSFWILAETHILQAKLSLITLDMKGARHFLTQAQQIADKHSLQLLAIKISSEHDSLLNELNKWEQMKKENALLSERIELARLNEQSKVLLQGRVIEPPKLQVDQPVLLIIVSKKGNILLSNYFTPNIIIDETRLGEFLSSFNTFCDQIFSEMFDRVKFGEFTVLIKTVDSYFVCYLFQGQTYSARLKLIHFSEFVKKDSTTLKILEKATSINRIININENASFKELINNCFLSELQQFQVPFKAYVGEDPFVFISYSHTDKLQVYPIIKNLNKAGINIWYDEGIPISEDWKKFIVEHLERCNAFIVFITPRIINSENVRKEINFALNRGKKFFAIFLKETELPSDLEFEIAHIQHMNKYLIPETEFYTKLKEMLNSAL